MDQGRCTDADQNDQRWLDRGRNRNRATVGNDVEPGGDDRPVHPRKDAGLLDKERALMYQERFSVRDRETRVLNGADGAFF